MPSVSNNPFMLNVGVLTVISLTYERSSVKVSSRVASNLARKYKTRTNTSGSSISHNDLDQLLIFAHMKQSLH